MSKICFLFLCIFIFFFNSCENDSSKKEWISIRNTPQAYPKDSITIDTIDFFNEVNWINWAYKNYPYKKQSPDYVKLLFDIKNYNPFELLNESKDKYNIEIDVIKPLKNKGVTHLVRKRLTPTTLEISLYLEKDRVSFLDCQRLIENLKLNIPYTVSNQEDEAWTCYNEIIESQKGTK